MAVRPFPLRGRLRLGALLLLAVASVASLAMQRAGLGAFPAEVSVDGALRGGTVETTVGIINDSAEAAPVELVATGEAATWLSFDSAEAIVPAQSRLLVPVSISVPDDAANGEYEALVRISAPGDEVTLSIEVPVTIEVVGTQQLEATIVDVVVEPAEVGGVARLAVTIDNTGNVAVVPDLLVLVESAGSVVDEFSITTGRIPPGRVAVAGEWDTSGRVPGPHRVIVTGTVDDVDMGTVTADFDLADRGTFTREVDLVGLTVTNEPAVGGVVAVEALMLNVGEIEAFVTLNARLVRDGQRLATERSIVVRVGPGESGVLEVFFPIEESGSYVVTGFLDYEAGETEPRSAAFGVEVAGGGIPALWWLLLALAVMLLIGPFVVRRRQMSRLRQRLDHGDVR
ncbi:MAG: hypothetical protein KJO84_05855 [Acidimicrobiia bacterium]|nr:hypothetical protein [Acidimicrobiia bacterium]